MQVIHRNKIKFLTGFGIVIVILLLAHSYFRRMDFQSESENVDTVYNFQTPVEELVSETESEALIDIIVDIKGAVKEPGVYQMTNKDRVIDLIERAGGVTLDANTRHINLAQLLTDQLSINIQTNDEVSSAQASETPTNESMGMLSQSTSPRKIDINQATQEEFETLPGIGPSKAAAILAYREEHGPFKAIEDLMNVSGIGQKTFDKLATSIQVGGLP